jgi:hypothetical protein
MSANVPCYSLIDVSYWGNDRNVPSPPVPGTIVTKIGRSVGYDVPTILSTRNEALVSLCTLRAVKGVSEEGLGKADRR